MVIADALGDSARPLPSPAAFASLSVAPDTRAIATPPAARPSRPSTFAPVIAPGARNWARTAAAADSAALRGWLVRVPTFTSRSIREDSLHVTIRRITFRDGCPLVSTLRASFVHAPDGAYDLVRLTTNCPRVP